MNKHRQTLERLKDLLWIVFIAGMVVGVGRFAFGLGAATNMMDLLPWGLWKIFNMVAGAALATSGFVVAAIIYIFQLKKYRPVARIAILVGFLGYGASLVALLFDIGLPHRGWHPFFMWNPHSFLFEVFWCVSLYWAVTAFELVPVITERFPLRRLTHFLHEVMLPVVILGITFSTLHHSSLGSLFMVSPTRLHPLWYSLWIPPEFFVSAMGAGLAVMVLLMLFVSWLFRRPQEMNVLGGLARASAVILAIYLVIKIADFTVNQKWNFVFGPDLTWESRLFWIEICLQAIVPIIFFGIPALRRRVIGLVIGALAAMIGLAMHRLNTGIIGYFRSADAVYIPNLSEFLLCFGVLSGAGLLFLLAVERLHIFDPPDEHAADHEAKVRQWTWEEARKVFLGRRTIKVLVIAVIVIPVTWFGMRHQATGPFKPIPQPIAEAIQADDELRETLQLDGNRNDISVVFPHWQHQVAFPDEYGISEEAACRQCHHLSLPNSDTSNCRVCHQDMLLETAMFNPESHQPRFEDEEALENLLELDEDDPYAVHQACMSCHEDNMTGLAEEALGGFSYQAPGFKQAMHSSCQTCHRRYGFDPAEPWDETNCGFCHPVTDTAERVSRVD